MPRARSSSTGLLVSAAAVLGIDGLSPRRHVSYAPIDPGDAPFDLPAAAAPCTSTAADREEPQGRSESARSARPDFAS